MLNIRFILKRMQRFTVFFHLLLKAFTNKYEKVL